METIPSPERETQIALLVDQAYEIIEQKYGLGSPNPKEYHNADHARDVVGSAALIADIAAASGNIEDSEKGLAIIAAAYHDVEQDLGKDLDEAASAELAAQKMSETGNFTPDEIQAVKDAILATKYRIDDDGRLTQSAASDNYLAQIVADADLANLGKEPADYWDRSVKFFHETHPGQELEGEVLREFADSQVKLLRNHRFYTREAENRFPHRFENERFTQNQIFGNDNII